jgi:hypothetical protein
MEVTHETKLVGMDPSYSCPALPPLASLPSEGGLGEAE